MGRECDIGFADLFRLAHHRPWSDEEADRFHALDQDARNEVVREWAALARCIQTEDRLGTDGIVYTAFWIVDGG